jgi:GT2 family glycosyltransferase
MEPSVDVIVPVHGNWALTASCLSSLPASDRIRIIVVDDASPDDTLARLAADWPTVDVVALERNRGFAAAVNAGIRHGDGDIVVLVNNDVIAEPRMVEELTTAFDDPAVGSATALLFAPDGTIDAFGICADPTMAGYVRLHGERADELERADDHFRLLGPYGAVAAYRRAALDEVGLLDEGIVMYGEELDLALRLSAAGWGTRGVRTARGVHLGGGTSGRGSFRQRYRSAFGRGYLLRAWRVLRSRRAVRALVVESAVSLADLVRSGDLASARGRLAGWRAARGSSRPLQPVPGIDPRIRFWPALRLRAGGTTRVRP